MPHIPRSGPPRPSAPPTSASDPDSLIPAFRGAVVEVDVREDLRNGLEPFSKIMAAVDALGPDEVLLLRATFEPAPLFRVLGKRGFEHHSVAHASDDWSVWFYRPTDGDATAAPKSAAPSSAAPSSAAPTSAPAVTRPPSGGEIRLDVRGLEPPEPMVRTLEALETLPAGAVLVQHNDRVPQFLLPILAERGFHHEVETTASDGVLVRITRAG